MAEKDEKRVEQMKKDYENFKVPEEAKRRIEEGIKMAKKEQGKEKVIRFVKGVGIGCVAAMATIVILANSSQTIAHAMEKIPIIGVIADVVTFRNYTDKKENFKADVEIPKVTIQGEENKEQKERVEYINKTIEEYANELIAAYEEELRANKKALKENGAGGHYSLTSKYEVICNNEKYLSIRIDTTVAIGSSANYVKIFNIDKNTGDIVSLKDLFTDGTDYISIISEEIKRQMKEQMENDENIIYFLEGEVGGFEKIAGEENFYFNKEGELMITFDEYTVAPGYMGVVEFTISKDVIVPNK